MEKNLSDNVNDIDKKLYSEFLNGNSNSLEILVEKYKNNLIYFIFGYVKNLETAEDIFQDIIIYLLEKKEIYNFKYSFKTFLYIIAKSKALNYLKKKDKEETIDINEREFLLTEESLLEDIIITEERREKIINIMKQMNKEWC